MPTETAWVVLTTAANHTLADILQGVLEAAGMQVMLAGESYAVTYGLPSPVQVLVPSDRLAEAQVILQESEEHVLDETREEADPDADSEPED